MKTPIASFVALALAAGTFAASATIPDSNGEIHGCRRKSDGRLRVINTDKGQKCRRAERAVNWNERGRRGREGPEGDRGPRGRRGAKGLQGGSGPAGAGSPITDHLTELSEVTQVAAGGAPISHTLSWTVPDGIIAKAYFRVRITTPPGACDSEPEASWTFALDARANDNIGLETLSGTINPGTTYFPRAGGFVFGSHALLPGDYHLITSVTRAEFVPACANTVVETEVFVVTEASLP
jgi:hypothetical protein